MNKTEIPEVHGNKNNRQSYRVKLLWFLVEEEIGLGDVIKGVTIMFGIQPWVALSTVQPCSTAGSFSLLVDIANRCNLFFFPL